MPGAQRKTRKLAKGGGLIGQVCDAFGRCFTRGKAKQENAPAGKPLTAAQIARREERAALLEARREARKEARKGKTALELLNEPLNTGIANSVQREYNEMMRGIGAGQAKGRKGRKTRKQQGGGVCNWLTGCFRQKPSKEVKQVVNKTKQAIEGLEKANEANLAHRKELAAKIKALRDKGFTDDSPEIKPLKNQFLILSQLSKKVESKMRSLTPAPAGRGKNE